MNLCRFIPLTWLFALALTALTGCANRASISPDAVVLQDPLPGQSLVYLMRAPYDGLVIRIQSGGKNLVTLPPGSYTALPLMAGRYVLSAVSSSFLSSGATVAPPLEITVNADQRVFYAISGVSERSFGLAGLVPLAGGGVVPIFSNDSATVAGSRSWKEYSELDARGLMTISKVVLPEH